MQLNRTKGWLLPSQELPKDVTDNPEFERQFSELAREVLPATSLG